MQRWRYEQRQGEPKFERMKKAYEEGKQIQRAAETCRSTPDAERHRQAATDAAIEEQLQAQCAYRTQGTFLQGLVNKIQARDNESTKLCATKPAHHEHLPPV